MRRRTTIGAILCGALIIAALLAPSAALANGSSSPQVTTQQVRQLIASYGPLLVLDPDEQYLLDSPLAVLNGQTTLNWGLVSNENDPTNFNVTILGSRLTSSLMILRDEKVALQDPHASDPDFRIWLKTDSSLWGGQPIFAKSYVQVTSSENGILELEFWFYYAYNGPINVKTTLPPPYDYVSLQQVGRHEGDWEHVTLRFTREKGRHSGWTFDQMFLSQHSGGQWLSADELAYSDGTHPIVYSALDSHANYATTGEHVGQVLLQQGSVVVNQIDYTGSGDSFAAYRMWNYQIVSSDVPGVTPLYTPLWFRYDGLWGPYQLDVDQTPLGLYANVDKGPVGPAQHAADPEP